MNTHMKIGFIGLGLMGLPMARNVMKKGFPLVVWNRTREKAEMLGQEGAEVVGSPREVAEKCDVVITMVTRGYDVKEVLFGEEGVAKSEKRDLVVIDMSTIGPSDAKDAAERLEQVGMKFLDAPVTGSTPKAESGELTIFIGGDEGVYGRVKDVLAAMGTNLHYVGKTGHGQAVKLVNNLLVASGVIALAEGMLLADKIGIERGVVAQALENTPSVSGVMKLKMPNFVSDEYPLLFSMKNMLKDIELASHFDDRLAVLQVVHDLLLKGVNHGKADKDFSEVIDVIGK